METRGKRLNNPCCIRRTNETWFGEIKPGSDAIFAEFQDLKYGYRATFKILKKYYHHYNLRTLRGMIHRWAPTTENRTDKYIEFVEQFSGMSADVILQYNSDTMVKIVQAMSVYESGCLMSEEYLRTCFSLSI